MRNLYLLIIALVFGAVLPGYGQSYRVYFTDKGSSEEFISDPYRFLSPQAVEKKALKGIRIDKSDLPVAPEYLDHLKEEGLKVEMQSRWFNYAKVAELPDPESVQKFPFVKKIEAVEKYRVHYAGMTASAASDTLEYGIAANQIQMLNGDYLHNKGLQGQGMSIAMFDGGFIGARSLTGLDSLWSSGRVKATYNFVDGDTNIFQDGSHGTLVLTTMAGYIDSAYAGAAILADYYLFKTEFEATETASEMDNWLQAAEYSDSIGVDIITSSLGYTKFDGGFGDYDYEDMDGNTTLVTRAADKAASKGMLVVVSAGNEGGDSWKYITAPADGDSVLSVGAVGPDRSHASFSSQGPTADGRIKPDVAAQGYATALIVQAGPAFAHGTSFASPIIAGLAACLWQSDSSLSNMQIYDAIRSSASQFYTPDNLLGYGIANFKGASWSIGNDERNLPPREVKVYPNPIGDKFSMEISGLESPVEVELRIFDLSGNRIGEQHLKVHNGMPVDIDAPWQKGAYILTINTGDHVYLEKIVK